eukprot:s344_g1.t1
MRNGLGLNQAQWKHLNILECANLIASRTAGSVEYMRLVRQRFNPAEGADQTDNVEMEDAESEEDDDAMDPYSEMPGNARTPTGATSVTELVEFLKNEHGQCLERQKFWAQTRFKT